MDVNDKIGILGLSNLKTYEKDSEAILHAIDSCILVLPLDDNTTALQMISGAIYILKMKDQEMYIHKIITEFGGIQAEEMGIKGIGKCHSNKYPLSTIMCVNIKGVFGVDVETEQIEFNYMVNDAKKHVCSSKAKSTVKCWIYNDDSSNNSDISKDYIAALFNLYKLAENELCVKIYIQENSNMCLHKQINLANQDMDLSSNFVVQVDDQNFPNILICITSSVIKVNLKSFTSLLIGKQSLGMVLGATIKQNIDGIEKAYIARNNGFLSVGDFQGNINSSVKFESKKKELCLGQVFSSSKSTIITSSFSNNSSNPSIKIALIDISGPRVLAYQELALNTELQMAIINKIYVCPKYNESNISALLIFCKAGVFQVTFQSISEQYFELIEENKLK